MLDDPPPKHWMDAQDERLLQFSEQWQQLRSAYVRSVLTLSSGALVVSIAFIGDLEPERGRLFLRISWLLFTGSILALISALIVEQNRVLQQSAAEGRWGERDSERTKKSDQLARCAGRLLACGGVLFAAGAVCLLVFAW